MSFAEKIHSILCTNSVYDKDLKNMQSTRSDASNEEQNETDSTLPKLKGDNSIEEERNSKTKERIAMQSNVLEHLGLGFRVRVRVRVRVRLLGFRVRVRV